MSESERKIFEGSSLDPSQKAAHDLAEEEEFGSRHPSGWQRYLIPLIAGSWSLFQLSLPKLVLLSSDFVRFTHLAFAITLVYLSFTGFKSRGLLARLGLKQKKWAAYFYADNKIPWIDIILAFLACASSLYYAFNYDALNARQGNLQTYDEVIGIVFLVFLLVATYRALGLALPLIASIFMGYTFFAESMPGVFAMKNASLSKLVDKVVFSTEGVFGLPLDVSARTVFLFVLFGALLERAGGGRYFIELAFSLLGRFKGGPGKASVLASGLTGLVSGSSIANTVTTGTFTIPLMKKAGYPAVKAGAIEVAASTNGQLMPPIMGAAAFILAANVNLPYFEVIRAATIPAVISYLALIYITHLEALKLDLKPLPKSEVPAFWPIFISGIHYLIPLFFLLYQLVIERRSPELSAFYAILSLIALIVIRNFVVEKNRGSRSLEFLRRSLIEVWESLVTGGKNMMTIGVAVAAAGIIVGVVTMGLGSKVTEIIGVLAGGNLIALLGITAVVSLILGMGLPTTANYIVVASLTAPAIVVVGGELGLAVPLIAAHLFVFYFGILADDTPPVGLSAYAASAISKADPIKTGIQGFAYDIRTAILPFMFIFNTDLLLIGVTAYWEIAAIFFTGMIAMFAFANLTRGYFLVSTRWYEWVLLGGTTFVLLRPDLFSQITPIDNKWAWKIIGLLLYGFVYLLQRFRTPTAGSGRSAQSL